METAVGLADAVLAQNYFGNTRSGSMAGPIGAFLVGALAVVTVLLIRNMNARIRRLPDRFPGQDFPGQDRDGAADPAGADPSAAGPSAEGPDHPGEGSAIR